MDVAVSFSNRLIKNDEWSLVNDHALDSQNRSSLLETSKMCRYAQPSVISHGAYGIVYSALDKVTGRIVALKEEVYGLCESTQREIDILKSLPRHPSIVELKDTIVDDSGRVFVVMEYLTNDLQRLMRKSPFTLGEVKWAVKRVLEGVKFLHENEVMHRDLKPSNILVDDEKGELKICDFGLSRFFDKACGSYSPHVVTLWYRAPELLLGVKEYSSAIDMWSVGCIMAEFFLKQVLFRGSCEIEQLGSIYNLLGTPDDVTWPGFSSLPGSGVFEMVKRPRDNNQIRMRFDSAFVFDRAPQLTTRGFDLLDKLLTYDPHTRITAKAALDHDWFRE